MPVDKRKAEPIVSTPLFAQSYLVTERERERERERREGETSSDPVDCNFGKARTIDIVFNRYQAHVIFICIT